AAPADAVPPQSETHNAPLAELPPPLPHAPGALSRRTSPRHTPPHTPPPAAPARSPSPTTPRVHPPKCGLIRRTASNDPPRRVDAPPHPREGVTGPLSGDHETRPALFMADVDPWAARPPRARSAGFQSSVIAHLSPGRDGCSV